MGVMKKKFLILSAIMLIALFIQIKPVFAHCPLCTAATGAAVGVARTYGVDDMIVGSLIGAFIISTALWLNNFLIKRNKGKEYIPMQSHMISLASFLLTVAGFYIGGLFNSAMSSYVLGIDKLFLGTLVGTFITLGAYEFHQIIRRRNNNKNYLPLQPVWLVLAFIAVFNIAVFLIFYHL
ncbi:MAG: hypothetical protein HZB65_01630 [Candidatus Aenigmarchaeota archaeon]|nr:hypothetical protein [Candidatus Aenigmarchaeota archaeon]